MQGGGADIVTSEIDETHSTPSLVVRLSPSSSAISECITSSEFHDKHVEDNESFKPPNEKAPNSGDTDSNGVYFIVSLDYQSIHSVIPYRLMLCKNIVFNNKMIYHINYFCFKPSKDA